VSWRTVSAVDGHAAAGSFAFGVGVTPPATAGPAEPAVNAGGTPAAIVARFLLYAGLVVLLGAGYVGGVIGRRVEGAAAVLGRLATGAWIVAAIGTAFVVAVSIEEAGADPGTVLGTSIGTVGIARGVAIGLAGLPILALGRGGARRSRWWLGLAALGSIGAMTVDVAFGHAAGGLTPIVDMTTQLVHGVASGLWVGGLASVLVATRGAASAERAAAIRSFSTWAAAWIVLVATTGVVRAIEEVGTFDALLSTPYGQLVIAKSVGLGLLGVLGATNRWWGVTLADRSLGRVRRVGAVELAVATVVVALAGAVVSAVPPVSVGSAAAAQPEPVVAMGSDAGTSLRLRLLVTPGTAGFDTFTASLTDFDTGDPVAAAAVSLRFELASTTGVGPATVALQGSGGTFHGTSGVLSIDGIWTVTATVTLAGSAVTVPLVLATAIADQPADALVTPGSPTIYTVHLADGSSAQLYLDPGTPGPNELHATFFDAGGTERPLTHGTMLAVPDGASAELLSARLLEPGHFVAEIDVDPGPLVVDAVGLDASGAPVHVHATIEVQP
jgi:copper transport protein